MADQQLTLVLIHTSGVKVSIDCNSGDDVLSLKDKVATKFSAPTKSIRLLHSGRELKPDNSKLNVFNIGKHGNYNVHVISSSAVLTKDRKNEIPVGLSPKSDFQNTVNLIEEPVIVGDVGTLSSDSAIIDLTDESEAYYEQLPSSRSKRKRSDNFEGEKRARRYRTTCPPAIKARLEKEHPQRLYLIEQSTKNSASNYLSRSYSVLGPSGRVSEVEICRIPNCSCADFPAGNLCKHMVFVMLRVSTTIIRRSHH